MDSFWLPHALPPFSGARVTSRMRTAVPVATALPSTHFDWASHDHSDQAESRQLTGHRSVLHV